MQPGPTPYDILPVPPIPYAPHSTAWLTLLACAMLLAAIFWLKTALHRRASRAPDPCTVLREALEALAGGSAADALPRASLAVKRYLSLTEGKNLSSLGPRELEREMQGCASADLRALLSLVLAIDLGKYGAGLAGLDRAATLRWLGSAAAAYDEHKKRQS